MSEETLIQITEDNIEEVISYFEIMITNIGMKIHFDRDILHRFFSREDVWNIQMPFYQLVAKINVDDDGQLIYWVKR